MQLFLEKYSNQNTHQ